MDAPLLDLITVAFLTYVPAYIANMMPPIAGALRLPFGTPIAPTLLGKNKTYRGIYAGMIGGIIGILILRYLELSLFSSVELRFALLLGALMGLGALIGDSAKSFYKRRKGYPSGHPCVPWDQIDFILGSTLFVFPLIRIPWTVLLTALLITPLLHLFVNVCAYHLGLKDVWW